MTKRRLILLIVSVLLVIVFSAVAVSCTRDGGFIRLRNGSEPATSEAQSSPTNTDTDEGDADGSIATEPVDYSSFERGDLLFNAVTVERHSLDLTTFMEASAAELEGDERIEIVDLSFDGSLRPDGAPVSVIQFTINDAENQLGLVGRQYAVVAPDDDGFSVVTCITDADFVDQCDDEMRTIDLNAF